jgi:hypothetical protein
MSGLNPSVPEPVTWTELTRKSQITTARTALGADAPKLGYVPVFRWAGGGPANKLSGSLIEVFRLHLLDNFVSAA